MTGRFSFLLRPRYAARQVPEKHGPAKTGLGLYLLVADGKRPLSYLLVADGKRPLSYLLVADGKRPLLPAFRKKPATEQKPMQTKPGRSRASLLSRFLQAVAIVLPAGYASAGDHAFVTNQPDNSLAIVDLDRMVVMDTLAIGGNPAGIALSADGKKAFVTSPESKTLTTIDAVNRTIIGQLTVGKGPLGVAVHPGGAYVYVADWYTHSLLAVSVETNKVIAEIPVGQSPSGVAVTPDGKTIVTADRDSNQISLIDAETLKVKATVPVGDRPFGVTIDESGTLAFTANVQSDDVSIVNLAELKKIATIKAGKRPYAIALAAGKGFVTNQYAGTLTVFDAQTFVVMATIPIGEYPEGIAPSSDGRYVYVANWFDNELAKLSTDSLKISGAVKTGEGPRAFGIFVRPSDPQGD